MNQESIIVGSAGANAATQAAMCLDGLSQAFVSVLPAV
jgi:hypothetical protein